MDHLYKGTTKYYPKKPGQRLRPFRPCRTTRYAEQLAIWQAVREEMNELCLTAKKKRIAGSYLVSKREQKNLESSLGSYWDL
jgi:hypothetical protein